VYLNELDQFVKRRLKCRYYLRYVDDMVLLAQDRETLVRWCAAIERFLQEQLKLALRPELTTPFPVRQGIDFVGWQTWWTHRVPRRRTLSNVRTRLAAFEHSAVQPLRSGNARRIDLQCQDKARSVEWLRAVLASYAGHLCHGAALRAWEALWQEYGWLTALFVRHGWRLTARWAKGHIGHAPRFQTQYRQIIRYAGDDSLVFCQVGRFIEFYGPQRVVAAQALRLRTVALPRAGYAFTVGVPVHLSGLYAARALRQGLSVVEVRQAPAMHGQRYALRAPVTVIIPCRMEKL
jgi:hypothetical protein